MSEGKKLLDSVDCKKGITLNSQIVDLLSILDKDISIEEQNAQITEYIKSLRQMQTEYYEAKQKGRSEQYRFIIDKVVDSIDEIPEDRIDEIKQLYLASIVDMSLFDSNQMEHKLIENVLDYKINELIMKQTSNMDFEAKEGILDLTPEKVRNFYSHMFNGDVPTYDRMTMDNAGKYSLYVCKDGETYADERLDKMVSFAEKHNMQSKVNTFMFYADFPKISEYVWQRQVSSTGLNEKEQQQYLKEKVKNSLMGYVEHLAQNYGDRIENVDIFNELIYDPDMLEQREIFEEEHSYHPREKGWQKYLNLEDLCEMALTARKLMPEATFTYNDMNWVNPEKRQKIIKIVKEIQSIENRYRQEGKLGKDEKGLIDIIGFEAHLTTGDKTQDIEKAFEDVEREIGLPIAITELDVARVGDDPLSREEITKQNRIIEKFAQLVQEGRIQELTVWSQSDEMSFMNDKCKRMVYASVILDENCNEKEYEPSKDVELQKFNYHTHTSLCGHADGTMEEYIKKAIEGGITDLGFSDHMPNPLGKGNPKQSMNLEQFHSQYIPMLEELRKKYKDQINLKVGLECEYYGEQGEKFPQLKKFREETEGKLDYMILGQHFALKRDENGKLKMPPEMSSKTSSQYPLDYAMTVVEAIKSGKFAYVAHPDIFLGGRDGVPEEEKALYLENAKKATQMICEVASKNNIPLEVNLGSISAIEAGIKDKMQDGSYAYPVPEFWKVAQAYGCKILIGMDAHTPEALREKDNEIIAKRLLEDKDIELDYLESYEPRGIEQNIGEKEDNRTEQDYTITPNKIGKKTIYTHIGKKDMSKAVVDRKVEERTHPQELDPHNHNGSQGGTNDGR